MSQKENIFPPPDNSRAAALAGTPLASFKRRTIALIVDIISAGVGFVLVTLIVIYFGQWTGLYTLGSDLEIEFTFFENWYSVIWLVLYFTLSVYLSNGRTIGKRLCRIRILSLVHDRVSLWHSFERALGYGASTLEFGFGFFQYFIRPDRRTIHDRIAETVVVAERAKKAPKAKRSDE